MNFKLKPKRNRNIMYEKGFDAGVDAVRSHLIKKLDSLSSVPGMGPKTVEKLYKHFMEVEQ